MIGQWIEPSGVWRDAPSVANCVAGRERQTTDSGVEPVQVFLWLEDEQSRKMSDKNLHQNVVVPSS